jgi:hypothetical protein
MKQWPGVFEGKKRRRGETADNHESRLKEVGEKANWRPTDGKGVRNDTGVSRGGEGQRFPSLRKPNP